ncbi:MAG: hypothetical protein BKP49_11130 [Treponema sp. CETP13]|nr:MAG: hypothetical protein BKP49_11130 [Treponema sp. CETP13]
MISEKLVQQMNFINEIEKLKIVYRQNGVVGGARQENSAEHSWHIAIMAFTLQEYAEKDIDILRVIKMLLIHDLVEIYAGDVFLYDDAGRNKIKTQEKKAADKLFGLLPANQSREFTALWNEYEQAATKEAKYALVLDNLQPILNHYYTRNQNIKGKKIKKSQVINKKRCIKEYSEELWAFTLETIEKSVAIGLFEDD